MKDTEAVPLVVAVMASSKGDNEHVDGIVAFGKIASPDAWTATLSNAKNPQTAFQACRTAMQGDRRKPASSRGGGTDQYPPELNRSGY